MNNREEYLKLCNSLLINDEIYYKKINDNLELYSYGCPDSIYDLETIAAYLDPKEPTIFIDTCCAIDLQEDISKRVVDRLTKIYPDRRIYITGCGVSYDPDYYKGKGILLNNQWKNNFICYKDIISNKPVNVYDIDHINGFVRISDGCNFNCSYCCIKNVRCQYNEIPANEIIKHILGLISKNVTDICLFGTEICSYGQDESLDLVGLIKLILQKCPKLTSIKLDTIHPGYKNIDELIKLIKNEPKMQKELDLGIQSCSDSVLQRMRRPYTYKTIKHIVKLAHNFDIQFQLITGFPGETEEEFNQTLEAVKELKPTRITLCPFSARKDTEAYKMQDQISYEIAKKREHKLIEAVDDGSNQKIEKEGLRQFNKFRSYSPNAIIIDVRNKSLYDTDTLIDIFKKSNNIRKKDKDAELVVYNRFDSKKDIKELDTNIKLLIVTFGAKVFTEFTINDETIKYNYPKLLTNDLTTFATFKFEKLNNTPKKDVLKFFKDVYECDLANIDKLTDDFSNAGNI